MVYKYERNNRVAATVKCYNVKDEVANRTFDVKVRCRHDTVRQETRHSLHNDWIHWDHTGSIYMSVSTHGM
jgi:hypothetical protein